MDTASGASIAVREILSYLTAIGWEISIFGSTIFDVESGILRLRQFWPVLTDNIGKIVHINDGNLIHHLMPVKSIDRFAMTAEEQYAFFTKYTDLLDTFKPDLVFSYGGHGLDYLIANEAADREIPMISLLVNGNYQATRWCRDVDLILTDSKATAAMYLEKQGFSPIPIATPINPNAVIADEHSRKNVLFVNPSYAKGVAIAITLALMLEKKRPDIVFEIVESRGNWKDVLSTVTKALGEERKNLSNVVVTPHTTNMKPIYGRARLLLAPSLWYESFGRVAAEAMMNGIPALVTKRGGLPEVIGDGGVLIEFPKECFDPPYTRIVRPEVLAPITDFIERCYDDEPFYQSYCQKALAQGQKTTTQAVVQRFLACVQPLFDKRAGDRALDAPRHFPNKQGL